MKWNLDHDKLVTLNSCYIGKIFIGKTTGLKTFQAVHISLCSLLVVSS